MTPEARLQSECFRWFRLAYPWVGKLFFAIPNGGHRNKLEAYNLKKQGVTPGVSDTFLAIPRGGCHGLWIELKYGKNNLSDEQSEFINQAKAKGYATAVVWSFDEFESVINNYLGYGR